MKLPVIPGHHCEASAYEIESAHRLADEILREKPGLCLRPEFRDLAATTLIDAPTLHIDDLSTIAHLDAGADATYLQERARLRAGDGDVVATIKPVAEGYEKYCCEHLGLGAVRWIRPHPAKSPARIAEACWEDDVIRTELACRARVSDLFNIHPHIGSLPIWELAALLKDHTGCSIRVVAPPPALTELVNDKIEFTRVVQRLFGPRAAPRTMSAGNLAVLADHVKDLADTSKAIGIKLASSAGGDGIVVLEAAQYRGLHVGPIRQRLGTALRRLHWDGKKELLVDSWETEILSSPSSQLWIPPGSEGEPVVEGVFDQSLDTSLGVFEGCEPSQLPGKKIQEIVNRSWLLAKVFQRLGYVGRCSFDMIIVGEDEDSGRLEFIECNGRWGGTSSPMTLMNRVFLDGARRLYISRICPMKGLNRLKFVELMRALDEMLYDRRSNHGRVILSLPGRVAARSAVDVIVTGSSIAEASSFLQNSVVPRLEASALESINRRKPPAQSSPNEFHRQRVPTSQWLPLQRRDFDSGRKPS